MHQIYKLAFALVAVLWWVAMWGLIDLFIHDWTKMSKFIFYLTLLGIIFILIYVFPDILQVL